MWNPDHYLEEAYQAAREQDAGRQRPWNERRSGVRAALVEALGPVPAAGAPLEPEVIGRWELEAGRLERVVYTTHAGLRMPAFVLVPAGLKGRAPAVIAWHGHGIGSRELVGLRADDTPAEARPDGRRPAALQLAERGLIVIAPEIVGFGDRRLAADLPKDPHTTSSCFALASRLLMCGQTLAGLRVYEAMRALDYTAGREDVDPQRIGCMGFSGGGLVAAFAAALDPRLQAALLCGFTNTFAGSLWKRTHCIDNYLPGILKAAELPELIGLIAPRSLFVESGEGDGLFPAASFREAASVLETIYREEGARERFGSDLFPGKHEVSGRLSFDWLAQSLKRNAPIE
ncbi:dienelactone hydrolase-like protein [Paenibacillus mucilaginosus 3016]|uniref:Dienelactone hydrolase-like protein n=1 Tax=Paenibacillus mucilaginosus 3016 TaxID=1116391 RepID=H6NLJ9_9BACL|nr:alpha/beta hydrolase family protein [Paenibacillus mucilaginosus]AFC30933.1 dienelactone hydrolase-like protein [Paenibacillus mucilaginosus 3016]WFA19530.1 dienelactone hydrolase [Paenibacillus mucilaginosus]